MIDIVLIESEHEGNVGAICRSMANFNFENLVLVNPRCNLEKDDFFKRAKHSKDVIKKIKVVKKIPKYDILVGTTAQISSGYNLGRSVVSLEYLVDNINKLKSTKKSSQNKIGILFGREGDGLTNEELSNCDLIVTINSSLSYPTLNLSQAVTIILYELSKNLTNEKRKVCKDKKTINEKFQKKEFVMSKIEFASKQEKERLLKLIFESLELIEENKEKRTTEKKIWKSIIGKSFLSKREVLGLMRFFRKAKRK